MTVKNLPSPQVVLTGFADECSNEKTMVEQFAAFAALGLQYYSVRFVNLGNGVKNVMKLTNEEIHQVLKIQNDYGLNVSSIGSPIGKIKLLDHRKVEPWRKRQHGSSSENLRGITV